MNSSRRYFLKVAGLSAFALAGGAGAAMAAAKPGAAPAGAGSYEAAGKALKAGRWAMVIDTRKINTVEQMRKVINACHSYHNVPDIPGTQEVKWLWDDTYHHAFADEVHPVLPARVEESRFFMLCNQCENPSCVRVCPVKATYKTEQGLVAIDYHRCIGCRFCMAGCPYGARSFNYMDPRKYLSDPVPNPKYPTRMPGVVEKCSFCVERLAVGLQPACVEASGGAILFGDLNDPQSVVRKALAENYSIRRKPSLGTQPGVYYLV